MRPSKDEWGLKLALVTAERATCLRRSVGCVLVNERGHVLATGYNGKAAGLPHCNESFIKMVEFVNRMGMREAWNDHQVVERPNACPAAHAASGTQLGGCEAIHAEQNALLQCRDPWSIHTCYVTTSPCLTCVKLLLNTSCERVVFVEQYAHDDEARELWRQARGDRGAWFHMPDVRTTG